MGEYCAGAPWSYAPCRTFWLFAACALMAALISLAILVFAARRWRIHVMRRESKKLMQQHIEEQNRIADDATMRQFRWMGDVLAAPEKDQAELTAEIRDALRSRKLNG